MATTKPRINVTLEPHRFELYKRLAALQGVSMSALVVELLEAVAEPMERVCVVLEAAKTAPASVLNGLRSAIGKAEAELMPNALKVIEQGDVFFTEVENAIAINAKEESRESVTASVEQPSVRAETITASSVGVPNPRLVTRGSTPTKEVHDGVGGKMGKVIRSKGSPTKKKSLS